MPVWPVVPAPRRPGAGALAAPGEDPYPLCPGGGDLSTLMRFAGLQEEWRARRRAEARARALDPADDELVELACGLRNWLLWGHEVSVDEGERRHMRRFLAGLAEILAGAPARAPRADGMPHTEEDDHG